jgi:hypothetical protein
MIGMKSGKRTKLMDENSRTPPGHIWLQWNDYDEDITWCIDQINENDILYFMSDYADITEFNDKGSGKMYRIQARILYITDLEEQDEIDSTGVDIDSLFDGSELISSIRNLFEEYLNNEKIKMIVSGKTSRDEIRIMMNSMTADDRKWFSKWYENRMKENEE